MKNESLNDIKYDLESDERHDILIECEKKEDS